MLNLESKTYYANLDLLESLRAFSCLSESDFDQVLLKNKIDRSSKSILNSDSVWSLVNYFINKKIVSSDYQNLKELYFRMSFYLHDIDKDYFYIKEKSFELDLLNYKNSEVVRFVEILSTEDSCNSCKSLEGKKFSIEEALDKKILPCKDCSKDMNDIKKGWCRCCYSPVI